LKVEQKGFSGHPLGGLSFSPAWMSIDIQNLSAKDPFAVQDDTGECRSSQGNYVHIRSQQRNGKKSLTTVQGIDKQYDYKRILKALKKNFNCNGTVVEAPEMGVIIQLQGDQRNNVALFLVEEGIINKEQVKVHGV